MPWSPPAGSTGGFVPHLTPDGVLGQEVYLLIPPVAGQRLQGLDNLGMQDPAPLLEQTVVGHLVRGCA